MISIDTNTRNEIAAVETKYGNLMFRMGLTHLVEVGGRHLDDATVEEAIKQIMAQGEADKVAGRITVMTPEFQCEIVRCAAELAKFSVWDLFAYIKECVTIGTNRHEVGVCPNCGSRTLEYVGGGVTETSYIHKWTCGDCGANGRECYNLTFSEHIIDWRDE